MYKKILAAVDFYDNGEQILERTAEIARAWNAEVHLIHIIDEIFAPYGVMGAPMPAIDQSEIEDGSRDKLTTLAAERGLQARSVIVETGHTVRGILEAAKRLDADLILVGSHGRHGIRLLLGSTANGVLHEADRDVLALRLRD